MGYQNWKKLGTDEYDYTEGPTIWIMKVVFNNYV